MPDARRITVIFVAAVLLIAAIALLVYSARTKAPEPLPTPIKPKGPHPAWEDESRYNAEKDAYDSRQTDIKSAGLRRQYFRLGGLAVLTLGLIAAFFSVAYFQQPGQAVVVKSFTGEIKGETITEGMHFRGPLDSLITYDIRNNTISYIGEGDTDYSGGDATGKRITVQFANGSSSNYDVIVTYSIDGQRTSEIYREYGPQENFVKRVIENDIRSVGRNAPGQLQDAVLFVRERANVSEMIQAELSERWAPLGAQVDSVNIHEILFPGNVQSTFDDAQAASNAQRTATAKQETARIDAETAVIRAQGEADANEVLTRSLTPQVLQQHYIDALRESGQLFVVPEGSSPLIQVPSDR